MQSPIHSFESLFEQLGLDSGSASIERFIDENKPVPPEIELCDAVFWSDSQAMFLKQSKEEDADWTEVVDQLDVQLR